MYSCASSLWNIFIPLSVSLWNDLADPVLSGQQDRLLREEPISATWRLLRAEPIFFKWPKLLATILYPFFTFSWFLSVGLVELGTSD